MSNFYAQVDSNRICVAVLDIGGVFNDPFYYPINTDDLSLIGQQLDIGLVPGDVIDNTVTSSPDAGTQPPTTTPGTDGTSNSSGCCLLFPETIVLTYNVNIKGDRMQTYNSDDSEFWQYFAYGGSYEYWDATTHYFNDNTSDQTIVDLQGAGVLTNIICPVPNDAGSTITITVTADDIPNTFESRVNNSDSRFCLGYLAPEYDSSDDDDDAIHYPSSNWNESDREMYVLIPPTAMSRGKSGIRFEQSLEITIRSSSGWSSTGQDSIGGASYMTYLPFGI